jgi:signal recognition particle subunit SRP54
MFEGLSEKLNAVFKRLRGYGKLSEQNIDAALREVRLALLEADVHFKVVKGFIASIKEKALGREVMESLTPGQQLVKIVHDELVRLMGESPQGIDLSKRPPISILLIGLQGSGKTTTVAKLANFMQNKGRKPFMIPADVYRPAAIDQLQSLGSQIGVQVYSPSKGEGPVVICQNGMERARKEEYDTVLIDTAGRLHIDQELMDELKDIKEAVIPNEILLVADAMTGQDAVNIAQSFNELLTIDGVILTKLDGDARGGAALSIKTVTQKPIKFAGVGEKVDALEPFYPDRMASRILGMGDVLSLIERAQVAIDEKEALELEKKIRKDAFTLEDFRDQLLQVRKMGPLDELMKMIPGMQKMKGMIDLQKGEKELTKIEAIINSMTKEERRNHTILNGSRRQRIARGSGTTVQDVNRMTKNYIQMRKMMKKFGRRGMKGMAREMFPF